ncbi:Kelch repeat type 1-containing protein [Formosa agariphila KMM 3901]|uniref:Kelch repeat type 1-containing protein n=1 Tax=Formosa agariphila (strain DSM 15362 / KCTC 12365 / LMG 23005 / KMM 3901 / M-2Alg 35-1) TaxID=1347342 RepID=T2KQY7_FORAG|nr:carboxypeptidase-like regulatory domain-containing protein [Formosa agariphila]CDF80399.1 Kelch repeat type 1-containing protein [Formosa agariphila KMM 3901]
MRFAFVLFFLVVTLTAQNIKGTVLDRDTNMPLEHVNVYYKTSAKGTSTNNNGKFELQIIKASETDFISFSSVGYATENYTLKQLKSLNYIVFLSKINEELDEVVVYSELDLQDALQFKKIGTLKESIHHFGATLVDDKIYVIGGDKTIKDDVKKRALQESESIGELFKNVSKPELIWKHYSDKLQVYDTENDTVIVSDLNFRKRAYHNVVAIDNKVYVLGGKSLSNSQNTEYLENKIEVFDLETNVLEVDNTYPHQAINFTSVAYQNNIIVMGGSNKQNSNGDKMYSNKSFIYNITSGYWYALKNMTTPKEVQGVLVKNKIFLIGGFNGGILKAIESYNLETGIWNAEGNLFYGIENPSLTVSNNIIYMFNNGRFLTYNVDTKVLNEYDIRLNLKAASLFCIYGVLYIVGGSTEVYYQTTPSPNIYAVDLSEFSKTRILQSKKMI